MLKILRQIISDVNSEGFQCDLVIGDKEFTSYTQSDVPIFVFELPTWTKDILTFEKIITLNYVLGISSSQNTNDIDNADDQLTELEIINELFYKKLISYQNKNGQQIFQPDGLVNVRSFIDLPLMAHPINCLLVTLRIKQLSVNHCTWKV